jgi:hypothetical protein
MDNKNIRFIAIGFNINNDKPCEYYAIYRKSRKQGTLVVF